MKSETRVPGGYAVVTVGQLTQLCALKKARKIGSASVRVWLAAVEQRQKRMMIKGRVRFSIAELSKLSGGLSERSVLRSLRELEREGQLRWSERKIDFPHSQLGEGSDIASSCGTSPKRPVPIPRRLLRLLARHNKPAEVIAVLAHLIRCLFKKKRVITSEGFVRAEWVVEVCGVSIRAVYAARAWLNSLGVLVQKTVHQFVMNKHGGLFEFVVDNLGKRGQGASSWKRNSAGLKKSTKSTLESTNHQKNNNPAEGGKDWFLRKKPRNISLQAVELEDIRRLSSLEKLYEQAVARNWFKHSEANVRNFVSAAVRATRVAGDPVKIFLGIVKKGLWHHATQEQEDRAIQALKRFRVKRATAFRQDGFATLERDRLSLMVAGITECLETRNSRP